MKKLLTLLLTASVLFSCSNSKTDKEKETGANETAASLSTNNDKVLTEWLKGKMLTSDDPGKDYHNFKLYADGNCEDKSGAKVGWTIEEGKLNIGGLMKISIEKKDDQTLILHRSLSDETYKVTVLP